MPSEAEFSYTLHGDVLAIEDLDLGARSVTNDAERVLRKIEGDLGPLAGRRILYRDTQGRWDGMEWDGRQVRFFSLGETEERAALRKLRPCSEDGAA